MTWDKLEHDLKEQGVVLALGAGVSAGCGLPTWRELLRRLADSHGSRRFETIEAAGLSLPAAAGVIERSYLDREAFAEGVRGVLYRDFPYYPDGYPTHAPAGFIQHVRSTNPTLRAVASFCAIKVAPRKYAANPQVKAIITFNLDALLQAYTYARFRKRILRTVERPSASSRADKISVYDVHGFLRFDAKAGRRTKEAPDALVLTESDYFDRFNDPTNLFSYAFLYLMREHPTVFIGLSLQDDNLRRLLHYSQREIRSSYEKEGVSLPRSKALRHYAILRRPRRDEVREVVEESLRGLGVTALWLSSFSQLPSRLQGLYESSGHPWSDVW